MNIHKLLLSPFIALILCSGELFAVTNFVEKNGLVVIEAEHFAHQVKDDIRRWYKFDKNTPEHQLADSDDVHIAGASGGAYIELLPDTRDNHDEALIKGKNFMETPGQMAILSYPIYFNTPGVYYIWARAFSTGPEDNGAHFGLDGQWPDTSKRLQFCKGKYKWTWSSAQRVPENHCGSPHTLTVKIKETGIHTLHLSMREDGVELDKIILTTDKKFIPSGEGPKETVSSPKPATAKTMLLGIKHYAKIIYAGEGLAFKEPIYFDKNRKAMAINATVNSARDTFFSSSHVWKERWPPEKPTTYDLVLVTLGETDGESDYRVKLNGKIIGKFKNPATAVDYSENYFAIKGVKIADGATLSVESKAVTNGKIPENDETAYARGRWRALVVQSTE